jgi:hypothetical protein
MNRKQRRAMAAQQKKDIKKSKVASNEMGAKMALFGHLPDNCMTCDAPFDKTDREMVSTWHVAVREAEEKVNLYCPTCWGKAIEIVESMTQQMSGAENTEG